MTDLFELFVPAPRGTADLLRAELAACGASDLRERSAGVACRGSLEVAYRALWWSRVANRVLLVLARFPAADADALYAGARRIDWAAQLTPTGTLAVDATLGRSSLTHSRFVAQRVKDAVVDTLRTPDGCRPSVDTVAPELRINVHIERDEAQLAIDLAGESLHRRGYRERQGIAPIKENLAAALLLRAGWPALAAAGRPLIDPMCGAGTLPIEAALIAGDIAPGLLRGAAACTRWRGHDPDLWRRLAAEADARRAAGRARIPIIIGYDVDAAAVQSASTNLERAGLSGLVHVERRELAAAAPPAGASDGLLICNPPYGARLHARGAVAGGAARAAEETTASDGGARARLAELYRTLGSVLRTRFRGWEAAVLTGDPALGLELGITARRVHTVWNGALECRLLRLRVTPEFFAPEVPPGSARVARAHARSAARVTPSPGAEMFANRLRKNLRWLGRWARRSEISCFRLYDADLPEYALALDVYAEAGAGRRWVHAQEYAAPPTIDAERARQRLDEALGVLPEVLEVPVERIVFKRRERQRGVAQYERFATQGHFFEVAEGGLRFLVNLRDYLDTGLFLDHRLTRALLREKARDRDVLNLFCYTATASVYAAAGGARSTMSVDLSATYLGWAARNLELNGFGPPAHRTLQADCIALLAAPPDRRYDLIFLDPPSFSNSKRMSDTLDVQRDHATLIRRCMARLRPGGELLFSTNLRRFRLDRDALAGLVIEDLSRKTLPEDFKRNARIHQCFAIRNV